MPGAPLGALESPQSCTVLVLVLSQALWFVPCDWLLFKEVRGGRQSFVIVLHSMIVP